MLSFVNINLLLLCLASCTTIKDILTGDIESFQLLIRYERPESNELVFKDQKIVIEGYDISMSVAEDISRNLVDLVISRSHLNNAYKDALELEFRDFAEMKDISEYSSDDYCSGFKKFQKVCNEPVEVSIPLYHKFIREIIDANSSKLVLNVYGIGTLRSNLIHFFLDDDLKAVAIKSLPARRRTKFFNSMNSNLRNLILDPKYKNLFEFDDKVEGNIRDMKFINSACSKKLPLNDDVSFENLQEWFEEEMEKC